MNISSSTHREAFSIWWAPGERADNEKELFAFALVTAAGLVGACLFIQFRYGALVRLWNTFWEIMLRGG